MKKTSISKDVLLDLYENKKLTTFQIADKFDCCQSTMWKKLKEYGIAPRLPGIKRVNIPKHILIDLYLNKKLSNWEIGEKLKIPRSTVHRKLKELGIVRDRATAHIIYPRADFSGDMIEKAYLIGFRIGDLRVRKVYPNSKTISLACSSTIPEQIELINNLFKLYGRVWIKKSNDKKLTHCEAFLNESFDFLLSKQVPKFIFRNKKVFFSFLAGFVDAEGHIGIYRNMARFSIGNYDFEILFLIHKKLNEYGIKCNKPFSDKRKGQFNSQGYKYNHNYWHFRIHNMDELAKIFKELKSYVKHKNKVKALNIAILNVKNRRLRKSQPRIQIRKRKGFT